MGLPHFALARPAQSAVMCRRKLSRLVDVDRLLTRITIKSNDRFGGYEAVIEQSGGIRTARDLVSRLYREDEACSYKLWDEFWRHSLSLTEFLPGIPRPSFPTVAVSDTESRYRRLLLLLPIFL